MTADDDVSDLELRERVFNGGGFRTVVPRPSVTSRGRDEIADVPDHEQVARIRRSEEVGNHTAIGASNEQGVRGLPECQACEFVAVIRPYVLAKFDDSLDKFFHRPFGRAFRNREC